MGLNKPNKLFLGWFLAVLGNQKPLVLLGFLRERLAPIVQPPADYGAQRDRSALPSKRKRPHLAMRSFPLERLRGIEPLSSPWQGDVLPLNHSRVVPRVRIELTTRCSSGICSTTELPRHVTTCSGFSKFTKVNFFYPPLSLLFPKNPCSSPCGRLRT